MPVLVIGSRPLSLGSAVTDNLRNKGLGVVTAGISGEERWLDVTDPRSIKETMSRVQPGQVIVTAGINQSYSLRADGMREAMHGHMATNFVGPMTVLQEWLHMLEYTSTTRPAPLQFVAVSSNSAHVARRNSVPYCASKAALSMGLRCAARELSGDGVLVYGYEPGLLAGTPMTADAERQFDGPLHRMYGVPAEGLSTRDFAATIVTNLMSPNKALHGTMLRLDAGEQ